MTGVSDGWTLPQACGEGRPRRLGRGRWEGCDTSSRWVIGSESWEVWAAGILSSPVLHGGAPGLLSAPWPGTRTHWRGQGLTHPEYPFLHRSLHHGSLQLLLGRQVSRDGAVDLRSCLFLKGPQSGLGTERDSVTPPGQEGRTHCFSRPPPFLIPATRASLKAQLHPTPSCSFDPPGLLLWPLG